MTGAGSRSLLDRAAEHVGLRTDGADLIRDGSNAMWVLPSAIVARIGPPRSLPIARRQLSAARWLHRHGLRVVQPVADLDQPVMIEGHPITWWEELPQHRPATPAELGTMLRTLHELPLPRSGEIDGFGELDPFDGFEPLTDDAAPDVLDQADHSWLQERFAQLRHDYAQHRPRLTSRLIHGDAWQGNLAVPTDGGPPILIDLDRIGSGPAEWDLMPVTVDHTDFARITDDEYRSFVDALGGIDVTTSPAFPTLAAITELRWTAFVVGKASSVPAAATEACHRVACLRGKVAKPWTWSAF